MRIPEAIPESTKLFPLNGLGEAVLRHVLLGIVYEHVDNLVEVAGLSPNSQLIVGRGTAVQNRVNMFDFVPGTERVEDVINEIEQLANKVFDRDFFLFSEIKEHAIEPVSYRSPLVLLDQSAMVKPKAEV